MEDRRQDEHQDEEIERDHPLEGMNDGREERQGLQSELEKQPSHDQGNYRPDELDGEQSQGATAQEQREYDGPDPETDAKGDRSDEDQGT